MVTLHFRLLRAIFVTIDRDGANAGIVSVMPDIKKVGPTKVQRSSVRLGKLK